MRYALPANLLLMCVALIAPRITASSESAAMFFAVPMSLILVIGAAAATRAYLLARRQDRRPRWTAFLPLAVFLLAIAATLLLIYSGWTFAGPPTEVTPVR